MDFLFLLVTFVFSIAIFSKISRWGHTTHSTSDKAGGSPSTDGPTGKIDDEPDSEMPLRPEQEQTCKAKQPKAVPPNIPASRQLNGRAYVIDGDTIRIGKTKVRLAGIDAPELDQPYGQKSKWAMVKICKGQRIRVELTGETSYDRLIGTCYLPDGRDIGAELIKEGLAIDGGHYSKGKYRHLEQPGMRARLIRYGHRRPRNSVLH